MIKKVKLKLFIFVDISLFPSLINFKCVWLTSVNCFKGGQTAFNWNHLLVKLHAANKCHSQLAYVCTNINILTLVETSTLYVPNLLMDRHIPDKVQPLWNFFWTKIKQTKTLSTLLEIGKWSCLPLAVITTLIRVSYHTCKDKKAKTMWLELWN